MSGPYHTDCRLLPSLSAAIGWSHTATTPITLTVVTFQPAILRLTHVNNLLGNEFVIVLGTGCCNEFQSVVTACWWYYKRGAETRFNSTYTVSDYVPSGNWTPYCKGSLRCGSSRRTTMRVQVGSCPCTCKRLAVTFHLQSLWMIHPYHVQRRVKACSLQLMRGITRTSPESNAQEQQSCKCGPPQFGQHQCNRGE